MWLILAETKSSLVCLEYVSTIRQLIGKADKLALTQNRLHNNKTSKNTNRHTTPQKKPFEAYQPQGTIKLLLWPTQKLLTWKKH